MLADDSHVSQACSEYWAVRVHPGEREDRDFCAIYCLEKRPGAQMLPTGCPLPMGFA